METLTKNEVKELARIKQFLPIDRNYAERCADIWLRSAPNGPAVKRRQVACREMNLPDQPRFF